MDRFIHCVKSICKKRLLPLALVLAMLLPALPPAATAAPARATTVQNQGFESGDLNGWTVLTRGWAAGTHGGYAGVVNARSTGEYEMPTNQSGNYHLSGLSNGIAGAAGWELRSSTFLLSGSGWISVKMGGRAAAVKVYLANGTQVGYFRQNRYNDVNFPYLSMGGSWNDMATYVMDLSDHLGKELYVVLCDEAIDGGAAYASFDDVITYYDAVPNPAFRFDTVTDGHAAMSVASEVQIPWVRSYNLLRYYSEYEVKNGGFESGDLTDWTVLTEGFDAANAVVSARTYWDQQLPYNQSGEYHLNGWSTGIPEAQGWAVRSNTFVLGGSGFLTVKMGGNAAAASICLTDGTQIAYSRNFRFHDVSFPHIAEGGAWCDMATYVFDLSAYLGRQMYVELRDEVITDGWANAFFDDVVSYYETAPKASGRFDKVPDGHLPGERAKLTQIPWVSVPAMSTAAARQIPNGDFETGDLSGWTILGSGFPIKNGLPAANADETYWDQELPYNKSGSYFVNGSALSGNEAGTWRLRSAPFTLEGSGWISVKMGGHAAAVRVYKTDGTLVGEFDQSRFCDKEFPYLSKGGSWNDMATYLLDLTQNLGEVLYIELCDDPIQGSWANAFFDDVVTYYAKKPTGGSETVADGHKPGEAARRVSISAVIGSNNLYSPRNGGFELGNLTGWTVKAEHFRPNNAVVSAEDYGMNDDRDMLPYNQSGNYHLSGHDACPKELDTWELRSSPFTLAGTGYISVKMGGRTAAFEVRTAEDDKIVARCQQRRFNDAFFPHISKGGSWRDMATYVMDLSPYLGQKLVFVLMDEEVETKGWADAYFDDVIAYYPQFPTRSSDTVTDGYDTFTEKAKDVEIPWIYLDVYEDVQNQFPSDPAVLKDISRQKEPDAELNLYNYFMRNQGISDYNLEEGSLTFNVKFCDLDGNTTYYSRAKSLPKQTIGKYGAYVVEYRLTQVEKTQEGSFNIVVSSDENNKIVNGGFETGNLAGWTPLTAGFNADTAVISAGTWWNEDMPYNQSGNYHLDGWNTGIEEKDTWAVRSSTFTLGGSGFISVKMAGRGAAVKVYTADGTMIGYYRQNRFSDHDFPYLKNGGSWADMGTYVMDLSAYIGQNLYIELCDEADGGWGQAFFDDVITYYATAPDYKNLADTVTDGNNSGNVDIPWRLAYNWLSEPPANSNSVVNGDFETGDLGGWTILTEGWTTNANMGVISAKDYWGEKLPYNQGDHFHLDGWNTGIDEGGTWTVRSSDFTLGGSGWISVKMGGHAAAVKVYKAEDDTLIGHYRQTRWRDYGFPSLSEGGSWADMGTYVMDLSSYINEALYIELCDEAVDGWANAFFDDIITYYKTEPDWKNQKDTVQDGNSGGDVYIPWQLAYNALDHQVGNGTFETGDLTGWTVLTNGWKYVNGQAQGVISATSYWGEELPYNQAGAYHLDGWNTGIGEGDTWKVRSTNFTLSGSGYISVRMGGNAAAVHVYKSDGTEIGYYKQTRFSDTNFPHVGDGGSWADMGTYVMDLSAHTGEVLYIELCDEAAVGWAHAFFDEVVTYYETAPDYESLSDTVMDGHTGGETAKEIQIHWQLAKNELAPAPTLSSPRLLSSASPFRVGALRVYNSAFQNRLLTAIATSVFGSSGPMETPDSADEEQPAASEANSPAEAEETGDAEQDAASEAARPEGGSDTEPPTEPETERPAVAEAPASTSSHSSPANGTPIIRIAPIQTLADYISEHYQAVAAIYTYQPDGMDEPISEEVIIPITEMRITKVVYTDLNGAETVTEMTSDAPYAIDGAGTYEVFYTVSYKGVSAEASFVITVDAPEEEAVSNDEEDDAQTALDEETAEEDAASVEDIPEADEDVTEISGVAEVSEVGDISDVCDVGEETSDTSPAITPDDTAETAEQAALPAEEPLTVPVTTDSEPAAPTDEDDGSDPDSEEDEDGEGTPDPDLSEDLGTEEVAVTEEESDQETTGEGQ